MGGIKGTEGPSRSQELCQQLRKNLSHSRPASIRNSSKRYRSPSLGDQILHLSARWGALVRHNTPSSLSKGSSSCMLTKDISRGGWEAGVANMRDGHPCRRVCCCQVATTRFLIRPVPFNYYLRWIQTNLAHNSRTNSFPTSSANSPPPEGASRLRTSRTDLVDGLDASPPSDNVSS